MPKKKAKEGKPQVHEELKGFEITIDKFGHIQTNRTAEEMNEFLNKHVEDKKLKDRDDLLPLEDENQTEEETLFDDEENEPTE